MNAVVQAKSNGLKGIEPLRKNFFYLASCWAASVGSVGGFAPLLHAPTRRCFAPLANCATKQVKQGVGEIVTPPPPPKLTGWVWGRERADSHSTFSPREAQTGGLGPSRRSSCASALKGDLFWLPESLSGKKLFPLFAPESPLLGFRTD